MEILHCFKKVRHSNLSSEALLKLIPTIFQYIEDCDACHVEGILKRICEKENYSLHWKLDLYCCSYDNEIEDESEHYIVTFSDQTNKYFVDINGNFYTSEKQFLSSLPYVFFHTMKNHEEKHIKKDPDFNFLNELQNGFRQIFGQAGVDLLSKFLAVFQNQAEEKLKRIKVIYSFFNVLVSTENTTLNFLPLHFNTFSITDNNEDTGFEIDIDELQRYTYFCIFKEIISDNNIKAQAYTKWCFFKLKSLKDINKLYWNDQKLENYKNSINDRFGEDERLAQGCHEVAFNLLKKEHDSGNRKSIALSKFLYIIYWIQYKCTLTYNGTNSLDGIANDKLIITNFLEQFITLLKEVERCERGNLVHRFINSHSSAYHTNAHFNELRDSHKHINTTCTRVSPFLNNFKQEAFNLPKVSLDPKSDVSKIALNVLQKCTDFYLKTVPNFIFNNSLYHSNDRRYYTNPGRKSGSTEYFADNYIKGVTVQFEKMFVLTVHVPSINNCV